MSIGKKRRKRKKGVGLAGARARREKKVQLREAWESGLKKFGRKFPELAESLEEIRSKAAAGYQAPKPEYDVAAHLHDVYELVLGMGDSRRDILVELHSNLSGRSNATKYLSLMKAASAFDYSDKQLSKHARKLLSALKKRVALDDFESHRKGHDD